VKTKKAFNKEDKTSAFAEIIKQVEREKKKAKIIYSIGLSILVVGLFIFLLFSPFKIPVFSQLGDQILGKEEREPEEKVVEEIEAQEEEKEVEEAVEEGKMEEEDSEGDAIVQEERLFQEQPSTTIQNIEPTPTPEATGPTLKCSQYDYDYATAYIEAAEILYAERYEEYLLEVAEYDECVFGKTYNEIYEMCDSELSEAIRDPLYRADSNAACVDRYYENCEMNDSRAWYLKELERLETGIYEQESVLESCY
jgi:hypothetical protein